MPFKEYINGPLDLLDTLIHAQIELERLRGLRLSSAFVKDGIFIFTAKELFQKQREIIIIVVVVVVVALERPAEGLRF